MVGFVSIFSILVIEVACGERGDFLPHLANAVRNGVCDKYDAIPSIKLQQSQLENGSVSSLATQVSGASRESTPSREFSTPLITPTGSQAMISGNSKAVLTAACNYQLYKVRKYLCTVFLSSMYIQLKFLHAHLVIYCHY